MYTTAAKSGTVIKNITNGKWTAIWYANGKQRSLAFGKTDRDKQFAEAHAQLMHRYWNTEEPLM